MAKKSYWLMKSEPETYSIDDFAKDGKTLWDGIRNYQARNFMTQAMNLGDQVLFYHSNSKPTGVAGLAEVCGEAQVDLTAQDKKSKYYDPKASKQKPIWECVEICYEKKFPKFVSLPDIKETKSLDKMMLVKKGMRLSIQPVTKKEFDTICKMGGI